MTPGNGDQVSITISKYQKHLSIKTNLAKEKNRLDTNKASHSSDTPIKLLKQNVDFFSPFRLRYINKPISLPIFPSILKLAGITPVYEKDSRYKKSKYQHISVLLNLSKMFQSGLYKPVSSFFENIFPKYRTGFRKSVNRQSCLVAMTKNSNITGLRRRIYYIIYGSIKTI